MSEDRHSFAKQLASGGAIFGGLIAWQIFEHMPEKPEDSPSQLGGVAAASVILGILVGTPIGGGLGFGIGWLLDKMNIKL